MCQICSSIPHQPVLCSRCFRVFCDDCHFDMKKKKKDKCTICFEDFEPAPHDCEEYKNYLEEISGPRARYVCPAKSGSKLVDECQTEMTYQQAVEHAYKHTKQNQYKCNRCDHSRKYATVQELADLHWRRSCHGFQDIYRLCKDCNV